MTSGFRFRPRAFDEALERNAAPEGVLLRSIASRNGCRRAILRPSARHAKFVERERVRILAHAEEAQASTSAGSKRGTSPTCRTGKPFASVLSGRDGRILRLKERHVTTNASGRGEDAASATAPRPVPKIPFPKRRKVARDAVGHAELAILERSLSRGPWTANYAYGSPFTLLIAVILSAQCTDARVNLQRHPHLFDAYPTPAALAAGGRRRGRRARIVKSCGFFRTKDEEYVVAASARARRKVRW